MQSTGASFGGTRGRRFPRRALWATLAATALLVGSSCGGGSEERADEEGSPGTTAVALPPCPLEALDNATGPVEVVVWNGYGAKTSETLVELADRYNASQDKVRVRLENQGLSHEDVLAKYQAGLATGDVPGIAILANGALQEMVDSGTVLPAQSCIDAEGYDTSDFVPGALAYYSVDGVLYPGSVNLSAPVLYFNPAQFQQAGLDPATPPRTLAEVRAYAQQIKDAGVVDKPVVMPLMGYFVETWLTGDEVATVDNDNGRGSGETTASTLDTDQTLELFTWIRDMYRDGLLDAIPTAPGNTDHFLAFGNQSSSMLIESSTFSTSMEQWLKDAGVEGFAVGPLPGLNEPGQVGICGAAWYITNRTPPAVQAAAWDFLKWFNDIDQQVLWNTEGSAMPFRMSTAQDPRIVDRWTNTYAGRALAVAYQQLVAIDPAFPGPRIGPYDTAYDTYAKALDAIIVSGTAPEVAISDADTTITAAIEQYNTAGF